MINYVGFVKGRVLYVPFGWRGFIPTKHLRANFVIAPPFSDHKLEFGRVQVIEGDVPPEVWRGPRKEISHKRFTLLCTLIETTKELEDEFMEVLTQSESLNP